MAHLGLARGRQGGLEPCTCWCSFPTSGFLCAPFSPSLHPLSFHGIFLFIWEKSQSFWTKETKTYFVKAAGFPRLSGGSRVSHFWKKSPLFSYFLNHQSFLLCNLSSSSVTSGFNVGGVAVFYWVWGMQGSWEDSPWCEVHDLPTSQAPKNTAVFCHTKTRRGIWL